MGLNDRAGGDEPTAAEVTILRPFATCFGEASPALVENRASPKPQVLEKGMLRARAKGKDQREEVLRKKVGSSHGYRGDDAALRYLSPHEFQRYWIEPEATKVGRPGGSPNVKFFDSAHAPAEVSDNLIMVRRRIPVAPVMQGRPMPAGRRRTWERSARIMLTCFHPWTLVQARASERAPLVSALG